MSGDLGFVATRCSKLGNKGEETFTTVVFESYKSKKKVEDQVPKIAVGGGSKTNEKKCINIQKAKYEIMKFGSKSFKGADKEDAKIALAVSLGAKPPSRKFENYKELLKSRKEESLKSKEMEKLFSVGKNRGVSKVRSSRNLNGKKPNISNNLKRSNKNLLGQYGKVKKSDLVKTKNKFSNKLKKKK